MSCPQCGSTEPENCEDWCEYGQDMMSALLRARSRIGNGVPLSVATNGLGITTVELVRYMARSSRNAISRDAPSKREATEDQS